MLSAYDELHAYALGRPEFILQHVVDAHGAQSAEPRDKPIRLVFSLVGLYLRVEKGYSGRTVQRIHTQLGKKKRVWPTLPLPTARGTLTPGAVMAVPEGPERDAAIDAWCASVWAAYRESHALVLGLLRDHGIS